MAQLSSPGVSVTVIDESFYTPAAPGTVPLIIVASEESKQNGAGTGTAAGTLKANAGQVYLLTSQKDLADTFGTPVFKTDANNNPIHAGEQNEYGLQAAYSFLGVSNRAFVVRADIDTSQLNATANAPAGEPEDGTFWFDTANTKFGVFEWNSADADVTGGQTFVNKVPTIITDPTKLDGYSNDGSYTGIKNNIGAVGSYAIVAVSTLNKLWYKKPATNTAAHIWVEVGSEAWKQSWPTAQGTKAVSTLDPTLSIIINGSIALSASSLGDATTGLVKAINDAAITGVRAANIDGRLNLYSNGNGANSGNIVLSGTLLSVLGFSLPVSPATTVTYKLPALAIAPHTSVPEYKRSDAPSTVNGSATGSVWIKTTTPNLGADWIVKKYNAASAGWSTQLAPIYANNAAALRGIDPAGGGISLAVGQLYVKYNDDEGVVPEANFKIYARSAVGATVITSKVLENTTFTGTLLAPLTYEFTISETAAGSAAFSTPVSVVFTGTASAADRAGLLTAVQAALPSNTNIRAELNSNNKLVLTHTQGGDIRLVDVQSDPIALIFPVSTTVNLVANPTGAVKSYVATLWTATVAGSAVAVPSSSAPTTVTANGRLWYNSIVDEVDIMIHNGTHWVGYQHFTQNQVGGDATDSMGPIVSATKPTKQSDGTALANGDLWIDSGDTENYPQIYKYNYLTKKWILVDSSDQTTENGILFADARYATSGTSATPSLIVDLLSSDFLDFDAPDPALYPKGMLLWNLRRSGFNVKRFVRDYVDTLAKNKRFNGVDGVAGAVGDGSSMTGYYPHRWVSEAGNQENGAGTFGRKAQRKVIVQALQALVNSNQQIRDEESRIFNLMACPGYPELIGELVSLNYDRGLTAFVVGDTPARLTPDATSLSNWGNNVNGALEDNDKGLVSFDEYLGCFYPWGFTSDNIGNNVVVPPSHMMLRTIALSDNVSYPWFAPAGTRRGGITNASAVGYVDAEGEFRSVALNNGQRDTLAGVKVNPLTFITGTGLVNYGQYTRAKNASALDRINVARLVIYLRRQLTQLSKPYVFEPNDKITRDEIKGAAESLMLELVGQRALYDYIVVCDTSNNTPARIDRSELYLDIAIEPVKAVEFIYIPLRLKNTGEIKGLA